MTEVGAHAVGGGDGRRAAGAPDAKHPATKLAGPYGHPVHPILVTVPIGAWTMAFVFDLVSRSAGEPEVFAKGAFWLIGFGVLGALAASVFGLMDFRTIPKGTAAFKTAVTHLLLNDVAMALFAVNFLLRRSHLDDSSGTPVSLIVLTAVTLAVLGISGYLGGKLSYTYGVRVVDDARQREGFS